MSIQACLIFDDKYELYEINNKSVKQIENNPKHKEIRKLLKPFGGFGKKTVLIIGKELVHYVKEKYPPTKDKNIGGIVANDINDLFPMLKSPDFHYKISQRHKNYTTVHIWAWERNISDSFSETAQFDYHIPEDLLFYSEHLEVTIYSRQNKTFITAHNKEGFVTSKIVTGDLNDNDLNLFLKSLASCKEDVYQINSYIELEVNTYNIRVNEIKTDASNFAVANSSSAPVIALDAFNTISLKPFKISKNSALLDITLLYKTAAYITIIYTILSLITIAKLNENIENKNTAISEINKQITAAEEIIKTDKSRNTLSSFAQNFAAMPSALDIIKTITEKLPNGTFVTRFEYTPEQAMLSLNSDNPSEVIKLLSSSPLISNIEFEGSPKKLSENSFSFKLIINPKNLMPLTGNNTIKQKTAASFENADEF
ncbi:hypothetical protein MCHI_003691 [Candidatus Magnetoovum chiemensis]|nr:hypothetical protein MCHI_003691 [Candidatus Magnetoovum chiemensis]